ncbi:integrin alpha-8 [Cricetulus griseus]|nr:integrin alpha-8 [Cricetulus griseus]
MVETFVVAKVQSKKVKRGIKALVAKVQLDFLKQKGAIKRMLFLHSNQFHLTFPFVIKQQKSIHCQDFIVYLRICTCLAMVFSETPTD